MGIGLGRQQWLGRVGWAGEAAVVGRVGWAGEAAVVGRVAGRMGWEGSRGWERCIWVW